MSYKNVIQYLYNNDPYNKKIEKVENPISEKDDPVNISIQQPKKCCRQLKAEENLKSGVLKLEMSSRKFNSTADPDFWGPFYWITLHVSAINYPEKATNITQQRMKERILSLPYELPCVDCRIHADNFIKNYELPLEKVVEGKETLFRFYFDFHNAVNKRKGKPVLEYDVVKKMYSGSAELIRIN